MGHRLGELGLASARGLPLEQQRDRREQRGINLSVVARLG